MTQDLTTKRHSRNTPEPNGDERHEPNEPRQRFSLLALVRRLHAEIPIPKEEQITDLAERHDYYAREHRRR